MSSKTYEQLADHFRDVKRMSSIQAAIEWDQQTKLPNGAGDYRAEQITLLAGLVHQRKTDSKISDWLSELEDEPSGLSNDERSNVREIRRQFDKNSKLPEALVKELAHCAATGQSKWVEARKDNDFSKFRPSLEQMFELKRQEADAIGYDDCRYDALLDDFEPGAKTAEVAKVLKGLKDDLVPLVQEIAESKKAPPVEILSRPYPVENQQAFAELAASTIGFDFERGRLDVTHHPFCTELGPNDVRITTRYDENQFNQAFFGTLHETGHGLYEQGLRLDQYGLPGGTYCSLGIHESQSRLWENNVGRSAEFWRQMFPKAQKHFSCLSDVNDQEFYEAVNAVKPSLIRVEADEATYNLHIIIRFELEQALLNDDLSIADLPEAWNQKYMETLGIKSDTDSDGVLQDIHWSAGLVGYFPTYSLGNLYSCQFFDIADQQVGPLAESFESGQFNLLLDWLRKNVHQRGASQLASELMQDVTKNSIDHRPLIKYLRDKLSPIYGI